MQGTQRIIVPEEQTAEEVACRTPGLSMSARNMATDSPHGCISCCGATGVEPERAAFDIAFVLPCSKSKEGLRHGPASDTLPTEGVIPDQWPARDLYRGRQYRAMLQSIDRFRSLRPDLSIGLFIVSAGHGLLSESDLIAPYDAELGTRERHWLQRGELLGLPKAIDELATRARTVVFALSRAYLTACRLPSDAHRNAIFLAGKAFAAQHEGFHFVLAGRAEARAMGKAERDVRAVMLDSLLQSWATGSTGADHTLPLHHQSRTQGEVVGALQT